MKLRSVIAAALLLGAAACTRPVPTNRLDYVGVWQGPGVTLIVEPWGFVHVVREAGGELEASIEAWDERSFTAGSGADATRFEVQSPPRPTSEGWRMRVDGVELARR